MTRWTEADIAKARAKIAGDVSSPLAARSLKLPAQLRVESKPEDLLAFQLKAVAEKPAFERQFRIHPDRNFMADFFFPHIRGMISAMVVEVDGGGFVNGRHSRGVGIEKDCEKSSLIAAMPARLMRVTPTQIKKGDAILWILRALKR